MTASNELILFSGVATSRDGNGYNYVASSWVPYHMDTAWYEHSLCAEIRFSTPHNWFNSTASRGDPVANVSLFFFFGITQVTIWWRVSRFEGCARYVLGVLCIQMTLRNRLRKRRRLISKIIFWQKYFCPQKRSTYIWQKYGVVEFYELVSSKMHNVSPSGPQKIKGVGFLDTKHIKLTASTRGAHRWRIFVNQSCTLWVMSNCLDI